MSIHIDDWGVRRLDASNEAVAWADLVKVEIVTTDEGPWSEDLFFLLEGADGTGAAVSGALAKRKRPDRCDPATSTWHRQRRHYQQRELRGERALPGVAPVRPQPGLVAP